MRLEERALDQWGSAEKIYQNLRIIPKGIQIEVTNPFRDLSKGNKSLWGSRWSK